MPRITLSLNADEASVLVKLAKKECRTPAEHLRYLLLQDAVRCGLLPKPCPEATSTADQQAPPTAKSNTP